MTQPAEAQHQARRLGSRGIVAGQAAGQGQSFLNTFFFFLLSFELFSSDLHHLSIHCLTSSS